MNTEEWELCRSEIKWILSNVEKTNQESNEKIERLTSILYGNSNYSPSNVKMALKNLDCKSLMEIDSLERSFYCGIKRS
ncbi:MAG TPA: hypothetical protein VEG44_05835 [Candidatus Acidoferrales bacterium]|nr:hypothetical protein [Candidatus Acidoferrales bacterium]